MFDSASGCFCAVCGFNTKTRSKLTPTGMEAEAADTSINPSSAGISLSSIFRHQEQINQNVTE